MSKNQAVIVIMSLEGDPVTISINDVDKEGKISYSVGSEEAEDSPKFHVILANVICQLMDHMRILHVNEKDAEKLATILDKPPTKKSTKEVDLLKAIQDKLGDKMPKA